MAGDAKGTLSGTLSGDLEEPVPAPAARGTLSGDLDDEPPGAGTVKGTLSGPLEGEVAGEGTVRGTLSGPDDPAGAGSARGTLSGGDEPHEPGAATLTERLASFDFAIQRELGHGGMGIVWLAEQRSLHRPVALKTLKQELSRGPAAEKFAFEALITGRLEHPNIPPVHVFGRDPEGHPFLSMKLVKGLEWAKLLAPETDAERERAADLDLRGHLEILLRVCEAIAFAHSNGVIHRDLKPENVMVGAFGEVLVMDWGIALELANRKPPIPGAPRRPVGTPAYLPPEMAQADESRMGPWTDVFLLGGLLYEILTGTSPYRGDSLMLVLIDAEKGEVEPPRKRAPGREIPDMLAEICMRALAPKPEDRYPSAEMFAAAIRQYLRNEASLKLSTAALAELARIEEGIAKAASGPKDAPGRPDFYPRLAACVAELKQAVKLWEGNRAATEGAVRAHLAYAAYAIDQGDLHLAESQLESVPKEHLVAVDLRGRIAAIIAKRAADARRRRWWFVLLALALLVVAGLLTHQIQLRRRRARAVAIAEGSSLLTAEDRITTYWNALNADPDWPEGQTELGTAYMERANDNYLDDPAMGAMDLGLALLAYDRAVELKPGAGTYADRGDLKLQMGNHAAAIADFKRAAALAPESKGGLVARAELALAEKKFDEADECATAYLDKGFADENAYFIRSLARFAQGDLDGALNDAAACQRYRPVDEWYASLGALTLLAAGRDRDAAEKLFLATREHPRGPHMAPLLAFIAAKHGDLER
ncbi:MAG TPA: protein kinase, partial [Planctomycetota bacterium]|nr:protein kinase [Planctomycetota bacterium]